ncbi:MAG: DNA metabolism protein [Lachnospiraceae bacterium]|nr:DNA metabolism protein [Lachnospiraceae bacterium]
MEVEGMTTVFVCEDSLDGILTGVYDAWDSGLGHGNVRLEVEQEKTLELFCQYMPVRTDRDKADKVLRTIRNRLGEESTEYICQAAASSDGRKADAIYRMVVLGLSLERGCQVINCLTYGPVATVMELSQKTWHEAHKLMGFVRFAELYNGVLYAKIEPKHQVLPFLAPYFADRLRHENWMIHDVGRRLLAVYQADTGWVLLEDGQLREERLAWVSEKEERMARLWKCFHESIAVEARINPKLQRQLLAMRFRPYMLEFAGKRGEKEV